MKAVIVARESSGLKETEVMPMWSWESRLVRVHENWRR